MNPHRILAALRRAWPGAEEVAGADVFTDNSVLSRVESVVHELCHAVVFGIDPFKLSDRIDDAVGNRFFRILDSSYSDKLEIETLQAEVIVLPKVVRLHRDWTYALAAYAARGMRCKWDIRDVEKEMMLDKHLARWRAALVLDHVSRAVLLYEGGGGAKL